MDNNLISITFVLLSIFIHILISRFTVAFKINIQRQALVINIAIAINFLIFFLIIFMNFFDVLFVFLVFNLYFYIYFHIFNMSETARRIYILIQIYEKKRIKASEIYINYNSSIMINNRLDRLVNLNWIRINNGYFFINKKTPLIVGKSISFIRKMIGLNVST